MLGYQRVNSRLVQASEDLDVTLSVVIAHIQPELVETIWASVLAIQPDVSALGLAELTTVSFGNQWTGQSESLAATHFLNQLSTSGDVTPLIATTHLQFAVLMLVQIYIVVALQ